MANSDGFREALSVFVARVNLRASENWYDARYGVLARNGISNFAGALDERLCRLRIVSA